jgi:hypothetical protein
MNVNVISFRAIKRPRDWSSQELAEFYRVEASLVRADIPIVTGRGQSDEGDPWFVFCHAHTGDVIIHFARIDGLYVVASRALEGCVRGHDFRALIEAQIETHPLVIPRPKDGLKLFIHPAALLIALVTTCFFKLSPNNGAFAAEINEGRHGPAAAAAHTTPTTRVLVLDAQNAAAVLTAIAAGARYADSPGRANSPLSSWLTARPEETGQGAPTSVAADARDLHGRFERPQTHYDAQDFWPSSPEQARPNSYLLAPSGGMDHLGASGFDGQTPLGSLPTPSFYSASIANFPAMPRTGDPIEVISASVPLSNASDAAYELLSTLGPSLPGHVVTARPGNSTQMAVDHAVSAPANGGPAPVSPTPAIVTTNPTNPAQNAVQAIDAFVAAHPDFQVMIVQDEIIMYDPGLTPANISHATERTFDFSDGSSVILIGLPTSYLTHHAAPHVLGHVHLW